MTASLQPILISPWDRNGATVALRLLLTSAEIAGPSEPPYQPRQMQAMLRAAELLAGIGPPGSERWDHAELLDARWKGRLQTVPWRDEAWPDATRMADNLMRGLWQGFQGALRDNAVLRRQQPPRYYVEKAELATVERVAETLPIKMLHIFRDPRDVFVSARVRDAKSPGLPVGGGPWRQSAKVKREIELVRSELRRIEKLGGAVDRLFWRYEDMVADFGAFAAALETWLGVELNVKLATVGTPALEQCAADVPAGKSAEQWRGKLPRRAARLYWRELGDMLATLGYTP